MCLKLVSLIGIIHVGRLETGIRALNMEGHTTSSCADKHILVRLKLRFTINSDHQLVAVPTPDTVAKSHVTPRHCSKVACHSETL